MEKPKKLLRRELVETELLERAAELFAARGVNRTTLQDVAETMGLTRAALYHYFDSKEALLTTLVDGLTAARLADIKAIRKHAGLSLAEKLARITRAMALSVASQTARVRLLLLTENELPAELNARHAKDRRDINTQLVDLFAEGHASGELRAPDPNVAAFALLGMCNWIAMWFTPGGTQTADAIAEQYADLASAAFVRAPGTSDDRADLPSTLARMRDDLARVERLTRDR